MSTLPTHHRMEVYRLALQLASEIDGVARALPDFRSSTRDQLSRASQSMLFNIGEGAGEFSPGEKARFYRIARRSASETSAIMDFLYATRTIQSDGRDLRPDLQRVEAMLTALVKAIERRKP